MYILINIYFTLLFLLYINLIGFKLDLVSYLHLYASKYFTNLIFVTSLKDIREMNIKSENTFFQ